MNLKKLIDDLAARKKDTVDIKEMDTMLLNPRENMYVSSFLQSQADDLRKIIVSLKSSESSNGREQIKGYKENFFNEIIQNINDVKVPDNCEKKDRIDIDINKEGACYLIKCEYKDSGFKSKDIFGFCNTGMGAKGENEDGKFGLGIKAVLTVSDRFIIKSNVCIEYIKDETNDNITIKLNDEWDGKTTIAEYYIPKKENEHYGIHTSKIEKVFSDSNGEIFKTGEYSNLLFDFRALLFTGRIKNIRVNKWILSCKPEESECLEETSKILKINTVKIKKVDSDDFYWEKYLCYEPEKKSSVAFLLNTSNGFTFYKNRIYSVYYVKPLPDDIVYPAGLLINIKEVNSFRNDVAASDTEIKRIHNKIRNFVSSALKEFTDVKLESLELKKAVSTAFHNCLLVYYDDIKNYELKKSDTADTNNSEDKNDTKELGLFEEIITEEKTNVNLIKVDEKGVEQKYVVYKEDKEDYERLIETEEDQKKKEAFYKKVFEKNEVVTYQSIMENAVSESIRKLYERVKEEPTQIISFMLNWHGSVKDFICFRVRNNEMSFSNKDISLNELSGFIAQEKFNEDDEKVLLKIVGSYKILSFISKTGAIGSVNFIEYLFSDSDENNIISREINKLYDKEYSEIKEELKAGIEIMNCYEPIGPSRRPWNYYDYDCSYPERKRLDYSIDNMVKFIKMVEKQNLFDYFVGFECEKTYKDEDEDKDILLLNGCLRGRFKYRKKDFVHKETFYRKIIRIGSLIERELYNLEALIDCQSIIDKINNHYGCSTRIRVHEFCISYNSLRSAIEWFIGYYSKNQDYRPYIMLESVIEIDKANNECREDYIEFIKKITENTEIPINLIQMTALNVDGYRKKTVVYIGAGQSLHIKEGANQSDFTKLFSFNIYDEKSPLMVFYINMDKEEALSTVIADLGLDKDIAEQIDGYISLADIGKSVTSHEYENLLKHNTKNYEKNLIVCDGKKIALQNKELKVSEKKKLLLARGSYNGYCPVCGEKLMGEDNDLDKAVNKAILFTIKLRDNSFYQNCACSDCVKWLRKTVHEAFIEDDALVFREKIVSSEKETLDNMEKRVPLSNINKVLNNLE